MDVWVSEWGPFHMNIHVHHMPSRLTRAAIDATWAKAQIVPPTHWSMLEKRGNTPRINITVLYNTM